MKALNKPPGLDREFISEKWGFIAPHLWENVKKEARESIKVDLIYISKVMI